MPLLLYETRKYQLGERWRKTASIFVLTKFPIFVNNFFFSLSFWFSCCFCPFPSAHQLIYIIIIMIFFFLSLEHIFEFEAMEIHAANSVWWMEIESQSFVLKTFLNCDLSPNEWLHFVCDWWMNAKWIMYECGDDDKRAISSKLSSFKSFVTLSAGVKASLLDILKMELSNDERCTPNANRLLSSSVTGTLNAETIFATIFQNSIRFHSIRFTSLQCNEYCLLLPLNRWGLILINLW